MKAEKRVFGISKNNKGLPCPFKNTICEEGFCKGCEIYLSHCWEIRK